MLELVAAQDSVELLEAMVKHGMRIDLYSSAPAKALDFAAQHGAAETVRALVAKRVWSEKAAKIAWAHGHRRLACWLVEKTPKRQQFALW